MAGLRVRKALVGVLKEATPFTYNEPAAGDSYPAFDVEVSYEGESYQRKEANMHFGKALEIPGPAVGSINFKVLYVGGTAAGTAPYYKNALAASGLREEITAGTTVAYKPWSTYDAGTGAGPPAFINPAASYTVAVWEDGIQYAIKGAVGNVKLACKMGEPMAWEFSFKGAYVAPAADTFPAASTSALAPPTFLGAVLNVQGFAAVFTEFTVDLGTDVQNSENANDSSGIRGSVAVDRRIVATVNPEMELPATGSTPHDFFGKWRSGATGTLGFGPLPAAGAGLRMTFAATLAQYRAPKMGERNGMRALDIEMPIVTTGAEGTDCSFTIT